MLEASGHRGDGDQARAPATHPRLSRWRCVATGCARSAAALPVAPALRPLPALKGHPTKELRADGSDHKAIVAGTQHFPILSSVLEI